MASRESKISKQAASSITRHTTFTIMETLEIIRKPASATSWSVIMEAYKSGLLTIYDIKKQKKKITCKNLGQYRCCLIFNNPAPFQFCGRNSTA
jgi:hypothetical protein